MKQALFLLFMLLAAAVSSQKSTDTKTYGRHILDGAVKPSDDEATFRTLDSLFCKNKADGDFYFKVANRIRQLSDGALSEYVSMIAARYYFSRNAEFIRNTGKMTAKDLGSWLELAAFDIAAAGKDTTMLPAVRQRLDKLLIDFKGSDKEKAVLKSCNNRLYADIETELKD